MVGQDKVVVDGLGDADKTDVTACFFRVAGKLADRIHGVIAADIEEISNLIFRKLLEEGRVDFVL